MPSKREFLFGFFSFSFLLCKKKVAAAAATIYFHMICSSSQSHYFLEREMIICIKRMKFEYEHLFRVIAKCDTLESYCDFVGSFLVALFPLRIFMRCHLQGKYSCCRTEKSYYRNKLIKIFLNGNPNKDSSSRDYNAKKEEKQ